ncbi:hypothetical protein FB446DRAFT_801869 [Lentinula raphanica]|nr:hypothetical protein FB446DRAFT_801869 [Lentinula raphanica]
MPPITTADSAAAEQPSSILKYRRSRLSRRTSTLEDRMHHLETLIQAPPSAVFAAGGNPVPNPLNPSQPDQSNSSTTVPFHVSQLPAGIPLPGLHVFPLTNPSTSMLSIPNNL